MKQRQPGASEVLAPGFTTAPFWTEGLSPFASASDPLPARLDVAVIGGGYAGLSAARTLAAGGRAVAVFEAGRIGDGASSRSAGALGNVPKAKLGDLARSHGDRLARQIYAEARQAREFVERLVRQEQIDCELETGGRFIAAHSAKAFAKFEKDLPVFREAWGEVTLVSPADQHREVGSHAFFGGVRLADSATLQPALLHRGLAEAAARAGAHIMEGTRVIDTRRTAGAFEVATPTARFRTDEVVIATNAETGRDTATMRRLRRRLILVPAFALATEEMSAETLARVLPKRGSFIDTCKMVHYMAPAGRSNRLVMSGRAGRGDGGMAGKAIRIFAYFRERFPALRSVRVSHCWGGRFAVTGDWLPHIGVEEGVHYVLGCCGTGVPMSTWLGHKVAQKILGEDEAATAFDRPLPGIRFSAARNLLLPLAVRAYAVRDRWFR